MPTDLLESPLRPDPSSPVSALRRAAAALLGLLAVALLSLIGIAILGFYSLAHIYGFGLDLFWLVIPIAVLSWLCVVGALLNWRGRLPFGARTVFGGLAVTVILAAGACLLSEWAGAHAKAADARIASGACTSEEYSVLRSVSLPDSFVSGVGGAPDGSCVLSFWVPGDAGSTADRALLAQGWARTGTAPETDSLTSRIRYQRNGYDLVVGVVRGPREPGKGDDGVLELP